MGRWVGDSCWLYFHRRLELYSYIMCGFDTVQKDAYNIWIVSNISNRMQQRWNVFFWKALESKFEAIWFSLWRVPGSLGKHNKAQYTTLLPHLNFSPMSPKLFCTYPHIEKPLNYNGSIIFEIEIMKKCSPSIWNLHTALYRVWLSCLARTIEEN